MRVPNYVSERLTRAKRGQREREKTYQPKLFVAGAQLGLMLGGGLPALQDGVAPLDPALGGGLAQVDFLALVAASEGIEVDLLELGLALLLLAALGSGDVSVGARVENVLAVNGTLAEGAPALGVVVFLAGRIGGCGGDVELEGSEVGEDFSNAGAAVVVD